MRLSSLFLILGLPVCLLGKSSEKQAIHNMLYGLQELRTVIPERLWSEEFAVLVDTEAFEALARKETSPAAADSIYATANGFGSSEYYFLYAATTGEAIRLDDRYLQFINSPYWNTPEGIRKLFYLQRNHMKVAR